MEAIPMTRLSDLLRKEIQLTGTKVSCRTGRCGACAILIDGKLANACMTSGLLVSRRLRDIFLAGNF
ncbi:putative xanthine dehydrogenase subunit E [Bacillus subtilis]|nr:putative xanthine dehydrogenase subunit E [Bacillus subtilis]